MLGNYAFFFSQRETEKGMTSNTEILLIDLKRGLLQQQ